MKLQFGVMDFGDSYRVHILGEGHGAWCGRVTLARVATPGRRTVCRHCLVALIRRAEQAPLAIRT